MRSPRERLYDLQAVIEESVTEVQLEARTQIFDRIKRHFRNSGDDADVFYANLIRDWPTFLAYELDTMEGVPVFLAQWQLDADAQTEEYDDIWVNCSRQVGKTLWEASIALKEMIWHPHTTVLALAPTQDQLVVRDNFRHFVNSSDFIQEKFIQDGENRAERVKFMANGSKFEPLNLTNETKRGRTGNVIMIDEFQLITRDQYISVVQPMLSSNYTRRKLYRFMTPSFLYNPSLHRQWAEAKVTKDILTIEVNVFQGLDEGIKKATRDQGAGSIQEIFQEERIDCPFVQTCGACPAFLPHWFDKPAECCMKFRESDTFLQEYMATFPSQKELFFAGHWLNEIKVDRPLLDWGTIGKMELPRVVGIDLGGLSDPTEIVINAYKDDPDGGKLRMITVGRRQIGAIGGKGSLPSNAKIVNNIKTMYRIVRPDVIVMDCTRKNELARDLVTGEQAIPETAFLTNKTAERHGLPGIWLSGEEKAKIYHNHRSMIAQQYLHVYGGSPEFWKDYYEAHTGVRVDGGSLAGYTKFIMPKNDHIVDAAAYASFYAFDTDREYDNLEYEIVPRGG